MPQYNLSIPKFRIHDCRSLRKDTLVGSMSLIVYNAQGGVHDATRKQTVQLGDHEKVTTVQTNLLFQNVDVPGPIAGAPDGGSIAWSMLLANKGHQDSAFLGILQKATDALSQKLKGDVLKDLSLESILELTTTLGLGELFSLLTANCDGLVASLTFVLTAAQLAQQTANPDNWMDDVLCPGTDSPAGCGSNSKYSVYYSIRPTGV